MRKQRFPGGNLELIGERDDSPEFRDGFAWVRSLPEHETFRATVRETSAADVAHYASGMLTDPQWLPSGFALWSAATGIQSSDDVYQEFHEAHFRHRTVEQQVQFMFGVIFGA